MTKTFALSIRQPWATAIVRGGKFIENRSWEPTYRGPFFIHASSAMTKEEHERALAFMQELCFDEAYDACKDRAQLPMGGIIGRARLVDVLQPGNYAAERHKAEAWGSDVSWWDPEQYGFVLADIAEVPFLRCSGNLGFWKVHEEYAATLTQGTQR